MVIIAITIVVMMTIGDVQVLLLMKYSDMPLYCKKPNFSKYVFNLILEALCEFTHLDEICESTKKKLDSAVC